MLLSSALFTGKGGTITQDSFLIMKLVSLDLCPLDRKYTVRLPVPR
jgi:hypothetical protein